mgnify:FL=1
MCRNLAVSFSASSTQCSCRMSGRRVHIPAPLGRKSRPTIASRTEDLPLDCPPTTTIWGRHCHRDGRSWRRGASTPSPASAHASWWGFAGGLGARVASASASGGFGLPRVPSRRGLRERATRLKPVDEPEEGLERARGERRGEIHSGMGRTRPRARGGVRAKGEATGFGGSKNKRVPSHRQQVVVA